MHRRPVSKCPFFLLLFFFFLSPEMKIPHDSGCWLVEGSGIRTNQAFVFFFPPRNLSEMSRPMKWVWKIEPESIQTQKVSQWKKKNWVLIMSSREFYVSYKGISHEALVMALFHFDSLSWSFAERVQNIFPNSWTKSCKDIDVKEAEQYCVAHFLLCYVLFFYLYLFLFFGKHWLKKQKAPGEVWYGSLAL